AEGVGGGGAQAIGLLAQCPTQVGQRPSQIEKRPALLAVRPEDAGQPVTLDLPPVTQNQQRQQPLLLARAQRRQRLTVHTHGERSEQADLQRRLLRVRSRFHVWMFLRLLASIRILSAVTNFLSFR